MILLDTHTLVWLDEGSKRLGPEARTAIDTALIQGELCVAAISFWEVAMLVEKGRLTIGTEIDSWRQSLLNSGLQEIPLTGDIAISSAHLANFHGDPADRIIVATTLHALARIITADEKILDWGQVLQCLDARH